MIRKLPPERRRRGTTLAAHGCCCCCCCCLHSLGGLIGAAIVRGATPEAKRTVRAYWWTFLVLVVLSLILGLSTQREPVAFTVIVMALMLPAGQLLTSVFVLMLSAVLPEPLDLRTLGRLTWKGFLWGLVGFLIMAVPLLISSYSR